MDLAIRAAVIFIFILVVTRLMGKRELASLEPFDLILLVVLGDLVQQGVTQDDYSVTGAFIVIAVIAVLQVSMSFLSFRYRTMRRVLEGEPIVIIQDGKPIDRNMRRERLAIDEVMEQARTSAQIVHLDDIQFAIVENSGTISFIPKSS
jgi:uncharacterized membrane protein YcaP (DUF421 family)